ncbi:hypothetical protein [Marinoscillum sp.]|uniref:hypothetical protein n=1 Tax=Marinoscillum sp. TaxID=2024838 RepID=UPI003BABBAED
MITKSKESVVALVVTLLFVIATGTAVYLFKVNAQAEEALLGEKVKSEKMLSEKLALSKEIEKLKKDIEGYKGQSSTFDKKLADLEARLKKKEDQLNGMSKSHNMTINDYKKQLAELQHMRDQLNAELAKQNEQMAALMKENGTLKDAIAMMEVSNEELVTKNYVLSQIISENYGVEAHKKRNKLTVSAKKTKEIQLGFDVPSTVSENLSFVITSPDGSQTSSNTSKTISYTMLNEFQFSDATATASLNTTVPVSNIDQKKHVVLSYKPEDKLAKGVYQINIYSDGSFIGSSQLRLK